MLHNDWLQSDLDDRDTLILKLEDQLKEGHEGFRQELRNEILKEQEAAFHAKDAELTTAKSNLVKEKKDLRRVKRGASEATKREKLLLDKVKELESSMAAMESEEFKAADEAKYSKLLRDTVASICHWFRRECPSADWDRNAVRDAIELWGDNDINSEELEVPAVNAGEELNQPSPNNGGSV
ncbi:unnamed protein product [Linum trigynum]|uniref:Uncharacterized protein n=1 Tax=Linum trigynum TaxID=586398 RepID=A0AAV2E6I4_9ROSI